MSAERFTGETDPLGPGDFANGNMDDHEGFFRMGGCFLFDALRAYHAGSDRGELRALLVEAWGPSQAVSALRGLAARESRPVEPSAHTGMRCACEGPAFIPHPCPCDCHGPPTVLADLARGPRL